MYRYIFHIPVNGQTVTHHVNNYSNEELCQWVEHLRTRSGHQIVRMRKTWHTDSPSIQGIWTPMTNRPTDWNIRQFPDNDLSVFKPEEPTATERLLERAKELRLRNIASSDEGSLKT